MTPWMTAIAEITPIIATALFFCLLTVQLVRYFHITEIFNGRLSKIASFFAAREQALIPVTNEYRKTPWLWLLLILLLSRALIYAAGLAGAFALNEQERYLSDPLSYFIRWDANHYLGLAENWYVNEGDPRFHIVFFPLYPALVRLINPLFRYNTRVAGLFVSNACLYLSAVVLFKLMRIEFDERAARRAVRYLMFFPLSFFFSLPFSESVFLLTTLLSVYCAKKGKMASAIAFGALCAFSRLLGMIVCVPIFYEFLRRYRERKASGDPLAPRYIVWSFLSTCLVLTGFLAYLIINYRVTGDAFKFMEYESTHWSQSFGSLYNTLSYSLANALAYDSIEFRLSIWIPQSLFILLALAVLCATARRLNRGDSAYAILYLYIAVAPTWLLSGTRYIMALYALYPALALLTRKKWQDASMMAGFTAATCYFVFLYALKGCLY